MTPDNARDDKPSWDRVFSDLKVLAQRDYDGCDSATLVVRKKGMQPVCHPIICQPNDDDFAPDPTS